MASRAKFSETKTGEISIHATGDHAPFQESLHTLPEKFHGLTNTDIQLSSALCGSDHESGESEIHLSNVPRFLRKSVTSLHGRGFMEVETPMLVSNAGGAAARPFETHYNALDEDVKLRISLELYLKASDRRRT